MKTKNTTITLVILLVISNIIWASFYASSYLYTQYQEGTLKAHKHYISQLLAIIPVLSSGDATSDEIKEAAQLKRKFKEKVGSRNIQVDGLVFSVDEDDKFLSIIK